MIIQKNNNNKKKKQWQTPQLVIEFLFRKVYIEKNFFTEYFQ